MANKIMLTTVFAAILASAQAQQQHFQISGHLDGIASDSLIVYVQAVNMLRTERTDTIAMDKGDFSFSLNEKEARSIVLLAKPESGQKLFAYGKYIPVVALPGEHVTVNGDLQNYTLSGSPFYVEVDAYKQSTKEDEHNLSELRKKAQERVASGENKDSVRVWLTRESKIISDRLTEKAMAYIKAHPDADFSAYLIPTLDERMDEGVELLTPRARNGVLASYIKAYSDMKKAQKARAEAAEKIIPGVEAPDFTLNDMNGNPLRLSSLRGKYVVLDFWGSWCVWCIKGFPQMKEAYAKHKDKVEFLGIACNDIDKRWRDAVVKHQLPWLNVRNVEGNSVSDKYGVRGYPTKIVIDPTGKVAKVVVGEDPEFYKYLDNL